MDTVNRALPESLKLIVQQQVVRGGYSPPLKGAGS